MATEMVNSPEILAFPYTHICTYNHSHYRKLLLFPAKIERKDPPLIKRTGTNAPSL